MTPIERPEDLDRTERLLGACYVFSLLGSVAFLAALAA
jgi:hypothetical protein